MPREMPIGRFHMREEAEAFIREQQRTTPGRRFYYRLDLSDSMYYVYMA